ncbi:hypothetical protein CBR_g54219 [Chara braunii]|uniref:Nucleotide-diphospho-sugar transferase domain-containing protein n=1 Tax=Chara braunii TaxID=69332 RepID=A0A388K7B4_CHABU|nr:hypothetical protein CBR_g54219 [Chara braunii]|eukprot:GBG65926.1 hypothetical protein CBR_g54219 [Chara braunii]
MGTFSKSGNCTEGGNKVSLFRARFTRRQVWMLLAAWIAVIHLTYRGTYVGLSPRRSDDHRRLDRINGREFKIATMTSDGFEAYDVLGAHAGRPGTTPGPHESGLVHRQDSSDLHNDSNQSAADVEGTAGPAVGGGGDSVRQDSGNEAVVAAGDRAGQSTRWTREQGNTGSGEDFRASRLTRSTPDVVGTVGLLPERRPTLPRADSAGQPTSSQPEVGLKPLKVKERNHASRSVPRRAALPPDVMIGVGDETWTEEEKVEEEGCTTGYGLQPFLERLAEKDTIIICTVNWGFRSFFVNWLISVKKVGMAGNVLVFAEDMASWRYLEKHWPGHSVLFCSDYDRWASSDNLADPAATRSTKSARRVEKKSGVQYFKSEGYGKLVNRRPFHILACLRHGYSVLYTDIDTVFVKNPFSYILGQMGKGRGGGGGGAEMRVGGGDGQGERYGRDQSSSGERSSANGSDVEGEEEGGARGGDRSVHDFDGAGAWDGPVKITPQFDGLFHGCDALPANFNLSLLNYCTYLLFFQPTPASMLLMRQWIFHMRPVPLPDGSVNPPSRNQLAFNYAVADLLQGFHIETKATKSSSSSSSSSLSEEHPSSFNLRMRTLPNRVFPSGYTSLVETDKAKWAGNGGELVVFHANYHVGLVDKRRFLQKNSLWLVSEDPDGNVQWPLTSSRSSLSL